MKKIKTKNIEKTLDPNQHQSCKHVDWSNFYFPKLVIFNIKGEEVVRRDPDQYERAAVSVLERRCYAGLNKS
jgi:hypothetical protein